MVKKRLSATIEETILEDFNSHCDVECINKSKLLEKLIRQYMIEGVKGK